ncbi:hypothetical protein Q7O_004352 [Pectobacterium carotovorum subsp. carotovorum PCCS1]|nr:hypothetical protein [Pectobacterium carotovorum subsp. carotovorum PCCS1]
MGEKWGIFLFLVCWTTGKIIHIRKMSASPSKKGAGAV